MQKTHWKKAFKSDYLSASDVDGIDLSLVIDKVVYKECVTQSGKQYCNVAIFKDTKLDNRGACVGGTKPMILNVTNSKMIKKFAGNATHIEDWVNIHVLIYSDSNVRFGKEITEGLRIRPTQPKKELKLTPLTIDMIDKAVLFLKDGKTIEDLKKFYSISSDVEKELMEKTK